MHSYNESVEKAKKDLESIKDDFLNNRTVTMEFETALIEPVFIIQEMDTILDFINSCDETTKSKVLSVLKNNSVDKALFMTAYNNEEYNYVILLNISEGVDGKNLALVHSKSLKALGMFMAEFTDLKPQDVEKQYGESPDKPND